MSIAPMSTAQTGSTAHRTAALSFPCMHVDGGSSRAQTAAEAAEGFCQCVEKHVIGGAVSRIEREEGELRRVEAVMVRLGREQGGVAEELRNRVARAGAVLRRARKACRGAAVAAEADGIMGMEGGMTWQGREGEGGGEGEQGQGQGQEEDEEGGEEGEGGEEEGVEGEEAESGEAQ